MSTLLKLSLLGLFLLGSTSANPTQPSRGCVQLEVPVEVSAENFHIQMPRVDSNVDAIDWIRNMTTWSSPNITERITSPIFVNNTFTISAQLCVPSEGEKSDILQIATHGVAFDGRYWDVQFKPGDYSYVNAALGAGYSILTYDRLGTGGSQKPDAYEIVQPAVELEILKGLTTLARSGKLLDVSKIKGRYSAISTYTPNKVVHVGHSYGSVLTIALHANYASLSDGAILTGWLFNNQSTSVGFDSFGFEFAPENDPRRFGDRPSGYLVSGTKSSLQLIFLRKSKLVPGLLEYADQIKETATVGELAALTLALAKPASEYTGPVQFFMGELDYPLCDGDCKNTYSQDELRAVYPAASDVSVYLQPDTNHGLTLATNATAGYKVMFSYLEEHGL